MTKKKLPQTSLDAYEKKKQTVIDDKKKILTALRVLGKANYEQIADYLKKDRHAIGRRLSELERDEKIYKPGTKSKTKRNYDAFDYQLTAAGMTEYVYEPGKETAAESAIKLIKSAKQKITVQQDSLF